ncbi:MAG: hypothetical protein ABIN36_09020, partial [Ferruginibacter sp.]
EDHLRQAQADRPVLISNWYKVPVSTYATPRVIDFNTSNMEDRNKKKPQKQICGPSVYKNDVISL